MIAIIDYGMGNIHSVKKALEALGAQTIIAATPADLAKCEKIVLPGVGAFDDAMVELEKRGLIPEIKKQIQGKKAFLGICLGMQLLFEESQEAQVKKGLGILKGKVKRFNHAAGLKVPHMGWNQLRIAKQCPLLKGMSEGSYVYFCHSYYPEPADGAAIAATTEYGVSFASVAWQDNVYGAQFHPEKSQAVGLQMLKNFIAS